VPLISKLRSSDQVREWGEDAGRSQHRPKRKTGCIQENRKLIGWSTAKKCKKILLGLRGGRGKGTSVFIKLGQQHLCRTKRGDWGRVASTCLDEVDRAKKTREGGCNF